MDIYALRTWLQARFAKDERGAGLVECILLVALIAKFSQAGSRLSTGS